MAVCSERASGRLTSQSPPREEGWLRHQENFGEAHLSAADGVVAHKQRFGVSDHPGRLRGHPSSRGGEYTLFPPRSFHHALSTTLFPPRSFHHALSTSLFPPRSFHHALSTRIFRPILLSLLLALGP